MKRASWLAAGLFVALFVAITAIKRYPADEESEDATLETQQKERIRNFWDHFNAASSARSRDDFVTAAERYRKALELNPAHEDSLFYLAVSLQEVGKYKEAAASLRRLTEMNPASNRAFSQLGSLLVTLAPGASPDFDAAAAAFSHGRQINYEESGPFLRLGLLELNRGNLGKARDSFAVAARGGAPEGIYLSGLTDYLEGRYPSAARMFLQVLEANAREKAISGRGVFSEGDIQAGQGTGALSAFERAGIKALVFLYWASERMGGYPASIPGQFRLHGGASRAASERFRFERLPLDAPGRGAFLDYDRDGRPDLLVAQPEGVALFQNTRRAWVEATRLVGLAGVERFWEVSVFDDEGDGWPDLYLVRKGYVGTGRNALYRNEQGRFREVTAERGLSGERATARAVAADFTGDGRVDLLELGNSSETDGSVRLFVKEGSRFLERSAELGLSYPANAVDAAAADFDGDGSTDVFILGWKSPGRLFRHTGTGFADVTAEAGLGAVGGEGFSVLAFDYNRDGKPDLLVSAQALLELSLQRLLDASLGATRQTPRLFRNAGKGRFEEVTASVGLNRCYGVMQVRSADFDGDGWPDLIFAHGGLQRERLEPSLILRNEEGRRFVEWSYLPAFDRPHNSLGTAEADVDGDGRPDVFLAGFGLLRSRAE